VTSTNTGIGFQLYGLELANTAFVALYNDDFSGNLMGGDGIAASLHGVSSANLSFPQQEVGTTSSAQTINFWSGMIVAPDLNIQTSGNFSQTNNCGTVLAAYATCQIQVTFTPSVPGMQNGRLTIADSSPDSPQTISLTGTGIAESQGISSTSVSFSSQQVATTSSPQTLTLWAGAAALNNLVIQTSSNFSETNNCGRGLPVFATCQIQITFTPSVPGTQNGRLTIADSSPNSPQTISLTGIGVDENPGASSTSVSFPDQQVATTSSPQAVTLWAGTAAIQNLVIQTKGNFSQTNNCGSGLAPSATCQIQIVFTPSVVGTLQGSLTITDSLPQSPLAIPLSGTGVAPGLGLGVAAGSSGSVTVTPGATAKYLLSIGGSGIGGMASLSCAGLPIGAQCGLPATQSVSATQATTFPVNVTTATQTTAAVRTTGLQGLSWLWGLAILGIVLMPIRARTGQPSRRYSVRLLLLLWVLCACSGVSSNVGGTPPGSYKLMITAKIGATSQQVPLVLTVR